MADSWVVTAVTFSCTTAKKPGTMWLLKVSGCKEAGTDTRNDLKKGLPGSYGCHMSQGEPWVTMAWGSDILKGQPYTWLDLIQPG